MYEIEDISENVGDGFEWLSVISNMEILRVQVATSSDSKESKIVLHIYNQDGDILNMEEYQELINHIEGTEDDFDYSDEWKELESA